jgi:short-subunit dehydrogenase
MTQFEARYGPWAVVAGASEGIGAAFSRRLAAEGVNVVLVARREGPLATLASELHDEFGIETRVVALDLSATGAEQTLFAATSGLEVGFLVYNAGADENGEFFLDVAPDVWAAMVHRNCTVPLLATHHYTEAMVARGRGGVILVTSGAAWAGGARLATYAATKAFDLVFGESLWAELGPHGVDVLSLVVGMTDTPAFRRLLETRGREMFAEAADPDDVAREGLEHLGEGPTWSMGMPDGAGPSMLGSLGRRDAVEAMSAGSAMTIGPAD